MRELYHSTRSNSEWYDDWKRGASTLEGISRKGDVVELLNERLLASSGAMETVTMPEVIIHGFETSNNIKVRIALGYKDIPYTFHTIDPANREELLRLSGQRLTPVLVHGDRVLFDSAAILRYLEANFRDRPSLFGTSLTEQWAIEDLELFARHTLAAPMMEIVHHRVSGGVVGDAMQARCTAAFMDAAGKLLKRLDGHTWLIGESMSAADVTAAAVMYRIRQAKLFGPPPGVEKIREWEDRVTAFDRYLNRPEA